MNKVVILRSEDWEILYVNKSPAYEGHSVHISNIYHYCPIESINMKWVSSELEEKIVDYGKFPKLEECLEIDESLKELFD